MKRITITLLLFSIHLALQAAPLQTFTELSNESNFNLNDQSFCYQSSDDVVHGINNESPRNPASVTKLFLSMFALKMLGADYRFKTSLYLSNNKKELYIESGHDPFFVSENLFNLMIELNQQGITKLDRLYIDSKFEFNWEVAPITKLQKYANTAKWTSDIQKEWTTTKTLINKDQDTPTPILRTKETIAETPDLTKFDLLLVHSSNPLIRILKMLNSFSSNILAESLFNFLGGEASLQEFIEEELHLKNTKLITGSGLGTNSTTCLDTLRLLKTIQTDFGDSPENLATLFQVAGVDEGTLQYRFTNEYASHVLAKTGTLNEVSALAGFFYQYGKLTPFAIFHHVSDVKKAKENEDAIIKSMLGHKGPFPYAKEIYSPLESVEIHYFK